MTVRPVYSKTLKAHAKVATVDGEEFPWLDKHNDVVPYDHRHSKNTRTTGRTYPTSARERVQD